MLCKWNNVFNNSSYNHVVHVTKKFKRCWKANESKDEKESIKTFKAYRNLKLGLI